MVDGHSFLGSLLIFILLSQNILKLKKYYPSKSTNDPNFIRCSSIASRVAKGVFFLLIGSTLVRDAVRRHHGFEAPRKHKFFSSRVGYYSNSTSTFQQAKLVFSGDIHLNPGPNASSSRSTINNSTILSCALLDCRSLCNKLTEFQGLVYGNDFDIAAVTETWLRDGYLDNEILPDEYAIFRKDRSDRRGGGVLLAVKRDILAYRRCDLEPLNSEILVCELCPGNSFKITFCVAYRPPNCTLFLNYFDCLLMKLELLALDVCVLFETSICLILTGI